MKKENMKMKHKKIKMYVSSLAGLGAIMSLPILATSCSSKEKDSYIIFDDYSPFLDYGQSQFISAKLGGSTEGIVLTASAPIPGGYSFTNGLLVNNNNTNSNINVTITAQKGNITNSIKIALVNNTIEVSNATVGEINTFSMATFHDYAIYLDNDDDDNI
jgi:hypothetical protein